MPRKRRAIPWVEVRNGISYVYWYDGAAKRTKRLSLGVPETDTVETQKRFGAFLTGGHATFNGSGLVGLSVVAALDDYNREHIQSDKVVDKRRAEITIDHLKRWFTKTTLPEVDIALCEGYANQRREAGIADSTIRRELVSLQSAARHALRWKRITAAEMPVVDLPAEDRREAEHLTKEQLALAFDTPNEELRDFIHIAYYTAGRRRSVENLTIPQIDLKFSSINLTAPTETAAQRRSKKKRPVVPLFPEIRPIVERRMAAATDAYLFPGHRDMYQRFKRHMRKCGLSDKSKPHILRHTRASHLLQDGVRIEVVAELLGDTIATVEKTYKHLRSHHVQEGINRATVSAV